MGFVEDLDKCRKLRGFSPDDEEKLREASKEAVEEISFFGAKNIARVDLEPETARSTNELTAAAHLANAVTEEMQSRGNFGPSGLDPVEDLQVECIRMGAAMGAYTVLKALQK